LEELREELTQDEYDQMKQETVEQMQAFQEQLESMKTGNLTLIDEIN
jgi:hypothetical protein